jgi:potassium-transporting ATPase KdpC subunit
MTNSKTLKVDFINDVISSVKNMFLTIMICCILYPGIILIIGKICVPNKTEGSLIRNSSGVIIGSHIIAQKFMQPKYFWPRPSAVDYNASGSGGSNLATTNNALRLRIQDNILKLETKSMKPVPLDLVTTSGSGLDPDISLQGAFFQAERVAKSRGVSVQIVNDLILRAASKQSLGKPALVNVLELNLLLDRSIQTKE